MAGKIKAPVQAALDFHGKPHGRGGWRPGAGRPRGRAGVSHDRRERFPGRFPLHVTLRIVPGINLRKDWLMPTIHGAIRDTVRTDFRVVEFNVMGNHLHLIVEAASAEALASGMNGLEVRLARRLNRRLRRRGKLFADRYHARPLRTPREVRNALRYVLLNRRHHAAEKGEQLARHWFDPFSSAPWFDGWSAPLRARTYLQGVMRSKPTPCAAATTWLLRTGWRRWGPLRVDEAPGAGSRRRP
jgi:REP element-mobilizing transposase RayT